MREIKFRAWDSENEIMFTEEKMVLECLAQRVLFPLSYQFFQFMQYTGLKDKNGKEIYEGDVISMRGQEPCPVVWELGQFILRLQNQIDDYYIHAVLNPNNCAKVIGNIYENPELLKD